MVLGWQSFCFFSIPSRHLFPAPPMPRAAGATGAGLDPAPLDTSPSIAPVLSLLLAAPRHGTGFCIAACGGGESF